MNALIRELEKHGHAVEVTPHLTYEQREAKQKAGEEVRLETEE
jgi:hypothetical protein